MQAPTFVENIANTRERIVEAADQLFYQRGFEHTSFTDIAKVVQIARGNFYYHFKTKDDILEAVIKRRLSHTQAMLDAWAREHQDPLLRLQSFVRILMTNRDNILAYGCPVGSLCSELGKLEHASHNEAKALFTLFRTWLTNQFSSLGRAKDADKLAMQLLARSQGAATLGNAFEDKKFIKREVKQMCAWVEACASKTEKLP